MDMQRAVACHEAGHAVALLVHDLPIETVSIRGDDVFRGHVVGTGKAQRQDLRNLALAALAGPAAQQLMTGQCSEDDEGPDRELAAGLIGHLGLGSERQEAAYLAFLQAVTDDFVRAEYSTIHEFAVVLEDQGLLSAEQAREAFTEIRGHVRASEWTQFDWP